MRRSVVAVAVAVGLVASIVEGDHVTVSLDGQLLFRAWDRVFLNDGHVALWTEEDTVARFDRIEIKAHPWSERD